MIDCNCPFCGADIDMSREDPMGDDDQQEVNCPTCDCTVIVTASVHVTYEAHCPPGQHDLVPNERHPGWVNCKRCDMFCQADSPEAATP